MGRRAAASTLVVAVHAHYGRDRQPFTLMTISDEEEEDVSADVESDMVGGGKLCVMNERPL